MKIPGPSRSAVINESALNESKLNATEILKQLRKDYFVDGVPTIEFLLPIIFRLDGKPYSLKHHYQFEPYFKSEQPAVCLTKTGRQTGKTRQLAARTVAMAALTPYYRILVLTPLYEQVRRLSTEYIRPFIDTSPFKSNWIGSGTARSVLQRSFRNESVIYFSFAGDDVDRVRGISVHENCIDEIQHIDITHLPIIHETVSHSLNAVKRYSGTPLTMENTVEGLWQESSQAEWFIKCQACNFWNIPAANHHLYKMIGPMRKDISETQPGLICAKCARPLSPVNGFWKHRYPEKAWSNAGYHIPQPIMWIHYAHPKKWAELLAKQEGRFNFTPQKFMNEVLGESCGVGAQLISQEDLKRAAVLPWDNDPRDPNKVVDKIGRYVYRVLAVDWGGGGEKGVSLTALAVLGITASGRIECIWGGKLVVPLAHMAEAQECLDIFNLFKCHFLAHDYNGSGSVRETLIRHKGVPTSKLVPIVYNSVAGTNPMRIKPRTHERVRGYYQVDKAKSLILTCCAIKLGLVKFFRYDHRSGDDGETESGLLHDFLSLFENKVPTARGSDVLTIQSNASLPDDFAQAVNMGCMTLWHVTGKWPDLGEFRALQRTLREIKTGDDLELFDSEFEIDPSEL